MYPKSNIECGSLSLHAGIANMSNKFHGCSMRGVVSVEELVAEALWKRLEVNYTQRNH